VTKQSSYKTSVAGGSACCPLFYSQTDVLSCTVPGACYVVLDEQVNNIG